MLNRFCQSCSSLLHPDDDFYCICCKLSGPVPKEEVMDVIKSNCVTCGMPLLNLEICCKCSDRRADLRAHYDAAYLAALGGFCCQGGYSTWEAMSTDCNNLALESVRTHAARMAELERLIAEVVENG